MTDIVDRLRSHLTDEAKRCMVLCDDIRAAADELDRLRAEAATLRKEKNDLVLKAYPAMDAVDRIRALIADAEYGNDLRTVAQIEKALASSPVTDKADAIQAAYARGIGDGRREGFNHGYVIACCNTVNLHDEPCIAFDVLAELGITKAEVKAMDLCEYDTKALQQIEKSRGADQLYAPARKKKAIRAAAPAPSPWRLIEDEQPPHEVPVLLWTPPSVTKPDGLIEARPFSSGRSGDGWSERSQHGYATHWMHLPEPPQGDA